MLGRAERAAVVLLEERRPRPEHELAVRERREVPLWRLLFTTSWIYRYEKKLTLLMRDARFEGPSLCNP